MVILISLELNSIFDMIDHLTVVPTNIDDEEITTTLNKNDDETEDSSE